MRLYNSREDDIIPLIKALDQDNRQAYRLALRITSNHADAEDALQESLLKAFLKLSQYRGEAPFTAWLASIVTREALTMLRRRSSRREVSLDDAKETKDDHVALAVPVDPSESPETCAIRAEFRQMVAESVEKLDTKFRVVFVMCEMGHFSIREMAEALELSVPAAKTRLFHARRRVYKQLRERLGKA